MKRILRWLGIGLGATVAIVAVAVAVLSSRGRRALDQTYEVAGLLSTTPSTDSASVAEGERQARINGCFICHGEDLSGTILIDAPPFLVVASNLTTGQGGIGDNYTVSDWDRAVRAGVVQSGHALLPIMPTQYYHNLSDEEFLNLVAYVSQLQPVDNELPFSKLRLLGQVLAGAGAVDLAEGVTTSPQRGPARERGPTAAYGEYLASITCAGCHGRDFGGGPALEPDTPAIPAIRTVGLWPFEAFDAAVRHGTAPDGRQYDPVMPYEHFAHMTDDEVRGLHAYFGTLSPAVPTQ